MPPSNTEYAQQALADMQTAVAEAKRKGFGLVAMGQGSLSTTQIGQTKIPRPFRAQGKAFRAMINGGNFVITNNAQRFAIARNPTGNYNVGEATQKGNAIVITKIALMSRPNLQLETYEQIVANGSVTIQQPTSDSAIPIDNRPIIDFLASLGDQVGVPALALAVATTQPTTQLEEEASAGMAAFGRRFKDLPDLDQPIFLVNNQAATLTIEGLSGAADGTNPTWEVVPIFEGLEFVGMVS